jgi:putative aldouronate transport system substrate-binding protein
MKKKLALILAMLLIVTLFAACGGGGKTTTTAPPTGQTGDDIGGDEIPDETEKPDSPYNFAVGNYEVDERGFPTGSYEYTLPLSTVEDEVFTYWMTCYTPQFIPEEGFGEMPYQRHTREKTGVNIEYQVINSQAMMENFSVMINSDDLSDLISGFRFYWSGPPKSAIEDAYIVNLIDYRDYMPNYMYQAVRFDDIDVYNTIFYDEETILAFYTMIEEPMPGMNYCARADWLRKLDMDPDDIITYDDVHEMLTRFKNELDVKWPMEIFKTVEPTAAMIFAGYDTAMFVSDQALPTIKIVDGVPTFTLTQQEDYEALVLIKSWLEEGLIDPAWTSVSTNQDITPQILNGETGYVAFNPGEIKGFEDAASDPDAEWAALKKVRKYEGQAFKLGSKLGHFSYGSNSISATCENIPLLVTYCDYFYSPEGSFSSSYGVQGHTWDYNEDGEIRLTDFVLRNPDGLGVAWVMIMNALNSFVDPGIEWHTRNYAYDGGERLLNMMKVTWAEPNYSGEYDWPTSLKFTDEQSEELNKVQADVVTYIGENFLSFVDGSKPLSEWDTYVAEAKAIGLDACQAIFQEAYDAFIAKHGDF